MYDAIMSDSLKVVIDFLNEKAPQGYIPIGPVSTCMIEAELPREAGAIVDQNTEVEYVEKTFFYVVIAKVGGKILH